MQVHVRIDGFHLNVVSRTFPGQQIRCLGESVPVNVSVSVSVSVSMSVSVSVSMSRRKKDLTLSGGIRWCCL